MKKQLQGGTTAHTKLNDLSYSTTVNGDSADMTLLGTGGVVMGNRWLEQLRNILDDDDDIEEVEVKVEYEDGGKRKWLFRGDEDPVLEDNDEEDDEDEEEDEEDGEEDDEDEAFQADAAEDEDNEEDDEEEDGEEDEEEDGEEDEEEDEEEDGDEDEA